MNSPPRSHGAPLPPRWSRRQLLGAGFGALFPAVAALPAAARAKPVLLVFPSGQSRIAPATTADTRKGDGLDDTERITLAARLVRSQLEEEGAVEAVLFDRESPAILRAVTESGIKPGTAELTEEQKLRIGSAFGAHYVLSVTARGGGDLLRLDSQISAINEAGRKAFDTATAPKDGKKGEKKPPPQPVNPNLPPLGGPTLELEAVEVKRGGKRWRDTITIGNQDAASLRDLAAKGQAYPTALSTAARSLVIRFLNGPLRDARLAAVDRSLLPPPAPPPPTVTIAEAEGRPVDPEAEAAEQIRRAETLRRDGQMAASLLTLRRAVSLAPRSLAPRLALTNAYLDAGKPAEAASEARRALTLVRAIPDDSRRELTRLVARALADDRDVAGARAVYEQAIKDDPNSSEFRLAYADLLVAQGESAPAEVQYRIVRRREPGNLEAARGFGRILAARGDFDLALKEAAESGSPLGRYTLATVVFIESANQIAGRIAQTRAAWEEGKVTREAFYKAVNAQSERATRLVALLTTSAPPQEVAEIERQAHKRRVLAGSLLSQAIASLIGYLETGEAAAAVRSRTLLTEFLFEMKQSQDPPRIPGSVKSTDAPVRAAPPTGKG